MQKGAFAAAIFVSAFLLFWVQPLFSKMVLPLLGGAPAVWNTAMMLFQVLLLAGYGYAHVLSTYVRDLRWQTAIHVVVIGGGLFFLPLIVPRDLAPPADASPIVWLVGFFAISVGWPFFALSASSPLLQAWFARSGHRQSADPYFLYVASNVGSLLALLCFPVVLEPALTLAAQGRAWMFGYLAFLVVLVGIGALLWRSHTAIPAAATDTAPRTDWRTRAIWVALAFVPSSLLLGVTTYITTDIASAPLLWVVPLALYLLSFIVAFAQRQFLTTEWTLRLQAIGILVVATMVTLVLIFSRGGSVLLVASAHLITFFITAVICHTELARRRPAAGDLTAFYFCMSLGGALGGIFNALIAPVIFNADYEYYLALVAACALRVFIPGQARGFKWLDAALPLVLAAVVAGVAYISVGDDSATSVLTRLLFLVPCMVALYAFAARPYRFALGLAGMIGAALLVQGSVDVLLTERNFFGINRVKLIDGGARTALIHGTTMHGTEFNDPARRREPLAYYARSGPAGQLIALAGTRANVGAIGLGTGALACYRKPGENWTFFEIDAAVERIAGDPAYFHYLTDCPGAKIVLGDGRLSLKALPDRIYDLLIVDAFSSDSIPMHLMTKEVMALYLGKLKPGGVILFNISNEYLHLVPVVASLVAANGAAARHQIFQPDDKQKADGASPSEWVAIAARESDLAFLNAAPRWQALRAEQTSQPWSDDFSNIFGAIRW